MPTGRIMIVEDESLVAEDLQSCLARSGYEVVGIADTFDDARQLAELERPDLALLDIRLKGQRDGIELAVELRRRNIGFVYLTSHGDEGTLTIANAQAVLDHLALCRGWHTAVVRLGDAAAPLQPRINEQLDAHFDYLESELRPSGHFIGDTLSAADIMLSFPAEIAAMQGRTATRPKLAGFVAAIHARPAWRIALEKGGAYNFGR